LLSDENYPVNLGNPLEIPILTLAEEINRITGNKAGIRSIPDGRAPADPQRRQPDISRAKEILDWEPQVDLETGLNHTIEDFKARL
jgi:dTDP-glucose 4,6-dehydratase